MGAPVKKRKKAGKTDARGGTREGKKHGRGPPPVRKSIPPVEGDTRRWDDGEKKRQAAQIHICVYTSTRTHTYSSTYTRHEISYGTVARDTCQHSPGTFTDKLYRLKGKRERGTKWATVFFFSFFIRPQGTLHGAARMRKKCLGLSRTSTPLKCQRRQYNPLCKLR